VGTPGRVDPRFAAAADEFAGLIEAQPGTGAALAVWSGGPAQLARNASR
jgi:hypothetical protein